jgi:hypothetical protein
VRAAFAQAHDERRRPEEMEATLARELGVSAERLRAAFRSIEPADLRGRGPSATTSPVSQRRWA